jgi:protein TonB
MAARRRPARQLSTLQVALGVSVTAHALLLAMQIAGPGRLERALRDTPLEVILVNARSADPPALAQAVAQANLAGGGDGGHGLAVSPLPPAAVLQLGDADAAADTPRQVAQLRATQTELLAQVRRELAALPLPDEPRSDDDDGPETPEASAQEERRRELLDLLAAIERRVNEHTEGRRRRYIGPAAREAVYVQYYDRLRRRIEEHGTREFPNHRGEKLYGELTMNLTVDAEGRVVETEIVRASSRRQLDRRAIAIVKAAAPFGPFTPAMRRHADELVVTSRFRFTHDDGLQATLAAPR